MGPFARIHLEWHRRRYDQDRINLWSDYGNHVWSQDPDFYMILEHWTDNNEEKALSDLGLYDVGQCDPRLPRRRHGISAPTWLGPAGKSGVGTTPGL